MPARTAKTCSSPDETRASETRPSEHQATQVRRTMCIAIGSSTGGTTALATIFQGLRAGLPPILLVQHLPAAFSAALATRLDEMGPVRVLLAEDDMECREGHAYLAPGGRHLTVRRQGQRLYCKLDDRPAIGHHRPAVAALFDSLVSEASARCIAVLLTGMGRDGADGMLQIKQQGGHTIAQDEATSIVWGMPGSAVSLGAAQEVVPLENIARHVQLACDCSATAKAS